MFNTTVNCSGISWQYVLLRKSEENLPKVTDKLDHRDLMVRGRTNLLYNQNHESPNKIL